MNMDNEVNPAPAGGGAPVPAPDAAAVPGLPGGGASGPAAEAAPGVLAGAAYDAEFVRWFLHRRVQLEIRRSRYRHSDAGVIDEITHRAWLRFHGASAQPIVRIEGFLTVIARRAVIDYVKSQVARDKHVVNLPEGGDPPPDTPNPTEDDSFAMAERLLRIALQIFERDRLACSKLWPFWRDKVSWNDVAEKLGGTADSLKQQWSRCLKYVRQVLESDPQLRKELGME